MNDKSAGLKIGLAILSYIWTILDCEVINNSRHFLG